MAHLGHSYAGMPASALDGVTVDADPSPGEFREDAHGRYGYVSRPFESGEPLEVTLSGLPPHTGLAVSAGATAGGIARTATLSVAGLTAASSPPHDDGGPPVGCSINYAPHAGGEATVSFTVEGSPAPWDSGPPLWYLHGLSVVLYTPDVSITGGNLSEEGGPVAFTVRRSGTPLDHPLFVKIKATHGSASAQDYAGLPPVVILEPGVSAVTLDVAAVDDQVVEGPEAFEVEIDDESADYVAASGPLTVGIADAESVVSVSMPASVNESVAGPVPVGPMAAPLAATASGTRGGRPARPAGTLGPLRPAPGSVPVTFVRTGSLKKSLTVPFDLDGSAGQGSDYSGLGGSVTFPAATDPAQTSQTYVAWLTLKHDLVPEWTETVELTLKDNGPGGKYLLAGAAYDPTPADEPPAEDAPHVVLEIMDDDLSILPGDDVMEVNNDDDDKDGVSDHEQIGPVSGEDDLDAVSLKFPQGVKPGATVTLSVAPGRLRVWSQYTKGEPIIDGTDGVWSKTWVIGQGDPPPATVYAEAIAASSAIGDAVLTLAASDRDADAPQRPVAATTNIATDATTNVKIAIIWDGRDVTGKKVGPVMVGEKISLELIIEAPAHEDTPHHVWNSSGGKIVERYVMTLDYATVNMFFGQNDDGAQLLRKLDFHFSEGSADSG